MGGGRADQEEEPGDVKERIDERDGINYDQSRYQKKAPGRVSCQIRLERL